MAREALEALQWEADKYYEVGLHLSRLATFKL
jgi:hypothetical protein